jgi:CrcB protein
MGYLIVFIGGGIGAALRHGFNILFARLLGTAFPYATLFENVSGSIVMGLLVATFAFRSGIPHHWQLFLTTRNPRRLHDIFDVFARCRVAL